MMNLFPHNCPISISFETYENPPTSTSWSWEQAASSWSAVTFRTVPNCVVTAFLSLIPANAKARSWMWRSWQRRSFSENSSMFVFLRTNRRIPWNAISVRLADSFRLWILFKFYVRKGIAGTTRWVERMILDWFVVVWMNGYFLLKNKCNWRRFSLSFWGGKVYMCFVSSSLSTRDCKIKCSTESASDSPSKLSNSSKFGFRWTSMDPGRLWMEI